MAGYTGRATKKWVWVATFVLLFLTLSLRHLDQKQLALVSSAVPIAVSSSSPSSSSLVQEPPAAASDQRQQIDVIHDQSNANQLLHTTLIESGHRNFTHLPERLQGKTLDLTKIRPTHITLETDLRHLASADDFLPYIAGISSVTNLSVPEAYGTCEYTDDELSSFIWDWNAPWVLQPLPNSEIDPLRDAWQDYVKHGLIPWSGVQERFDGGRGIVIVGGRGKEPSRMKVLLRALKKHGSQLPVEIYYWDDEMSETSKAELMEIYPLTVFSNLKDEEEQLWVTDWHFLPNYQFKTIALVNSRFSEILMLDGDVIPTTDPAVLFESQTYKDFGTVFWPDQGRTRKENPAWAVFNTPCRRNEYSLESGQLLVNKQRYFYHLQLAAWLSTSEYWNAKLLGDKDLFRFAWGALKTEFGSPVKWFTSLGFVAEQKGDDEEHPKMMYCGHSFGHAYPDHRQGDHGSGIAFLHANGVKHAGGPMLARLKAKGGLYTHFKRVNASTLEDWTNVQMGVGPSFFDVSWYYNMTRDIKPSDLVDVDEDYDQDGKPLGQEGLAGLELGSADLDRRMLCVDIKTIEPQPIEELGEDAASFEYLFAGTGGYWPIEDPEYRG